jgi:hypothetical protein
LVAWARLGVAGEDCLTAAFLLNFGENELLDLEGIGLLRFERVSLCELSFGLLPGFFFAGDGFGIGPPLSFFDRIKTY